MNIGDKVRIIDVENPFYDKEGEVESVDDDIITVMVDFIPDKGKRVRQDFKETQLEVATSSENDFVNNSIEESKKSRGEPKNDEISHSEFNLSSLTRLEDVFTKSKSLFSSNFNYTFEVYVADRFVDGLTALHNSIASSNENYKRLIKKLDFALTKLDMYGRFNGVDTEKVNGLPNDIDGKIRELKIGEIDSKPIRVLYFVLKGRKIVLGNIFYHKDSNLTSEERNSINKIYNDVVNG